MADQSFDDRYRLLLEKRQAAKREARRWATDAVLKYVRDTYDDWRRSTGSKEPCLTSAFIHGYLAQARQPDDYTYLTEKEQRVIVFSVLESLRKQGRLGSSTGAGSTGREARCYEPAPLPGIVSDYIAALKKMKSPSDKKAAQRIYEVMTAKGRSEADFEQSRLGLRYPYGISDML